MHARGLLQEDTQWPLRVPPLRVLFLCTKNSARSQMAEGFMHHFSQQTVEVYSAGSHPSSLHPLAIRAMAALDIDISQQKSKHVDEFHDQAFDYVITVCDQMREVCPSFPGTPDMIHWSIPDPAGVAGNAEEQYQAFEQTARYLLLKTRYLLTSVEHEQKAHV
jgi:ArsR family transcriptional regulator, arsenate/arsenite/antimonite-responsive transcriptional repressor / arsenate reductase (thioredoxin)